MVNTLKASLQTQASQSSYLALSVHLNLSHTQYWERLVDLVGKNKNV